MIRDVQNYPSMPALIYVPDVAQLLGVKVKTIQRWDRMGVAAVAAATAVAIGN